MKNDYDINYFKRLAARKGGRCLSTKFIRLHHPMKWQCKEGHVWTTSAHTVNGTSNSKGNWCPKCAIESRAEKRRNTIQDMRRLARKRNGKCLSTDYSNCHVKLHWECKEGHRWWAQSNNVGTGQWCPTCVGKTPTIREFQKLAQSRGGKLISKRYKSSITKMKWQCKKGHRWLAESNKIKQGVWCPLCAREKAGSTQRLSIAELQKLAAKNNGKLLSKIYQNAKSRLRWQCHTCPSALLKMAEAFSKC